MAEFTIDTNKEIATQIVKWAKEGGEIVRPYLLVHADDGVIWGKVENDTLTTSSNAFPDVFKVKLRWETIQQLRLFGPESELFSWQCEGALCDPITKPYQSESKLDVVEENVLLWGKVIENKKGFSLCYEGEQGLMHAPPIEAEVGSAIYLVTHQFITYDKHGQLQVVNGRLAGFK